jgi:hypothetical protein
MEGCPPMGFVRESVLTGSGGLTPKPTLLGVGVALVSSVAGCGGNASASGNTHPATTAKSAVAQKPTPTGWTGMGSLLTSFQIAHPKNLSGCPAGTCFGTTINNSEGDADEFVLLTTTGVAANRVDGCTQAFSDGTTIADAKVAVLASMPKDTRITSYFVQHDSVGSTCAFMNVRSRTLGRWFSGKKVGDAAGVMSVEFSAATASGSFVYTPRNIESASVSLAPVNHSINC